MTCPKKHRYTIATATQVLEDFEEVGKARHFFDMLPDSVEAFWVAYHPVPIESLLANPDQIMTYCKSESMAQENPFSHTVDLAKH
ncbi:hypothetical protein ACWIG4_30310 [Streptomyces sp. NPDC002248]